MSHVVLNVFGMLYKENHLPQQLLLRQPQLINGETNDGEFIWNSNWKCEKASAIIISASSDAPFGVVMKTEDDLSKMLKLLDSRYASNRTVSRISIQK